MHCFLLKHIMHLHVRLRVSVLCTIVSLDLLLNYDKTMALCGNAQNIHDASVCVCVVAISCNHRQTLTKIKLEHFHKQHATHLEQRERERELARLKIGMDELNGYIKSTGHSTDCCLQQQQK